MKNMDPLNDNVATLLHQSADRFVAELWKDGKLLPMHCLKQYQMLEGINGTINMYVPVCLYSSEARQYVSHLSLLTTTVCLVDLGQHIYDF